MKQALSSLLSLIVLIASFPSAAFSQNVESSILIDKEFNVEKDCPLGECVGTLVGLIEAKTNEATKDKCFPPQGIKDQRAWFEETVISVQCYKLNQEIDELIRKLEKVETYFKGSLPENGGQCCHRDQLDTFGFNLDNLSEIDKASAETMCTEDRKKELWKRCDDDALCVFMSTAAGIIPMKSSFRQKMLPENLKAQGCDSSKDNCMQQLAAAFVKSVFNFFEGTWGILKMAGHGMKSAAKNVWNLVAEAEEQSSTAQLAAAGASEEEGVFRMLINDFSGTMANLWKGLLAAIKHWLSNKIFCQEWTGKPHFSECKRPASGLDCLECKTMITGMCSLTGSLTAEVFSTFMTGGLVACAKQGASAAAKVATLFKVSSSTIKAIKDSKLGTMVIRNTTDITNSVLAHKMGNGSIVVIRAYIETAGKFILSSAFKSAKLSVSAMVEAGKRTKTYLMLSPAGPAISFGTKALKTAGKIIIYPIENSLMVKAFQMGEKSFEKIFSAVGGPKLMNGIRPALASEGARAMAVVDDAYTEMQVLNHLRPGTKMSLEAEKKYLGALRAGRQTIGKAYLEAMPQVKWENLLDELFPELHYGRHSKVISEAKILKAEDEVFELIGSMSNKGEQDRLMEAFQKHISSVARGQVVKKSNYGREAVLLNAALDDEARITKAFETAGIDPSDISNEFKDKMSKAVLEASNSGDGLVYHYSYSDIAKKVRILKEGGFNSGQVNNLVRSGIAGKARIEDSFPALRMVAVDDMRPAVLNNMLSHQEYGKVLTKVQNDLRPAVARALKIMEDGGMTPAQAVSNYQKFENKFMQVQRMSDHNSDASAYLAEIIKRQRKAGKSDEAIMRKLDDALKDCK